MPRPFKLRLSLALACGCLLLGNVIEAAEKETPEATDNESGFVALFDSETPVKDGIPEGWSNPYSWGEVWVEDGAIHLKADKKFFLVTDKQFADFILEAEIKLPAKGKSNSGIMFRCHKRQNKVYGYQAECDPTDRGWTGGLYDEGRRGWLHPEKRDPKQRKKKLVQAPLGEWIKYRIKCVGDHLQIFINGKRTTDYIDDKDAKGHIGLQHHGEEGQVYQFRNIRIKTLSPESNSANNDDNQD